MKSLALTTMLLALSICMAAQNSHIQVVAEPGISVFLDGQFKGITTIEYGGLIIQNVNSGQHTIKVIKEGYIPREETLTVKPGEVLMYQIDKNFVPAIKITEEGNKEKQTISLKNGNLTIQSLPISISIQIPCVGVNYIKQEDKFHAKNIPEGTYLAQFSWNEKILHDSIKIINEMVTYLFVNMIEMKIENKDYKYINESDNELINNVNPSNSAEVGNQGVESGTEGVRNYGPGGGTGISNISYDLAGRRHQSLPLPNYDYQGEGMVVVEVTVDKTGTVTKAVPGVKGSTTLDEYLLRVAREAALLAKFDSNPNAPVIQKGTITYNFKLK